MGDSIEKPQSIWQRNIEVDVRGLLATSAKLGVQSFFLKWDDAAETGLEVLDNLGLGRSNEEIAGVLILKSLKRAIRSLLKDNTELILEQNLALDSYKELDIKSFEKALVDGLPENVWVMNGDFFQRPQNLPMLEPVQQSFARWLGPYIAEVDAKNLRTRLPSYFVYALNEEWKDNADSYQVLLGNETPFDAALKQEQGWQRYRAYLQKKVDEPMFLESFGLRQVYVPLRAYYEQKIETEKEQEEFIGREKSETQKVVVDLETELRQWLTQSDPTDAIRLLSGGPGSGKSSFTRMLAASLSDSGEIPVLYVPLHWFVMAGDIEKAIAEFVQQENFLSESPLNFEDDNLRLLIIFDGLDELSMQGKFAENIARDFVREVCRLIDRHNHWKTRLQVIVSGREVVIQANQNQFRDSHQLLSLLPYITTQSGYEDSSQLLTVDQRDLWWQSYGVLKEKDYDRLPEELARENLQDITAQPLLNYLIALSYEQGKLEFTAETNLNEIYGDLLKGVYQRDYERDHRRSDRKLEYKVTAGIKETDFVRILEEIALTCWHGDGRTMTVAEIETQCKNSKLSKTLKQFQENFQQESGGCITRLLAAFYFRANGEFRENSKNFETTFEFTHKSFGEYLAAKRILRELKNIALELKLNEEDADRGCDEKEALTRWAKLCGATPMDEYIFRFVCDEMKLQKNEQVIKWQTILCRLFEVMLRDGMPMEELAPRPSFKEEVQQARNAEETLLAVLNSCARRTKQLSKIQWQNSTAFGTWLKQIQGQRKDPKNVLAITCLSWLDIFEQVLYLSDLYEANFQGANLQEAKLYEANLRGADLREANLQNVHLERTNLQGAILKEAKLEGAILHRAYLQGAYLRGANLEGANLEGAYLHGAYLHRANLEGANLEGANLEGAILRGANLEGANLERANLQRTNLQETSLQRVNLRWANLEEANLEGANLEGANLERANLLGTILEKS